MFSTALHVKGDRSCDLWSFQPLLIALNGYVSNKIIWLRVKIYVQGVSNQKIIYSTEGGILALWVTSFMHAKQ